MGFFKAVGLCYVRMFKFKGRASRSEYWWFHLFLLLFFWVPTVLAAILSPLEFPPLAQLAKELRSGDTSSLEFQGTGVAIFLAYALGLSLLLIIMPSMAVGYRRLQDRDLSGSWILVPLVVDALGRFIVIGTGIESSTSTEASIAVLVMDLVQIGIGIWITVLLASRGTQGDNRFGPDPLAETKGHAPGDTALAQPIHQADHADFAAQRRAEMREYYKNNVLKGIQRPDR